MKSGASPTKCGFLWPLRIVSRRDRYFWEVRAQVFIATGLLLGFTVISSKTALSVCRKDLALPFRILPSSLFYFHGRARLVLILTFFAGKFQRHPSPSFNNYEYGQSCFIKSTFFKSQQHTLLPQDMYFHSQDPLVTRPRVP